MYCEGTPWGPFVSQFNESDNALDAFLVLWNYILTQHQYTVAMQQMNWHDRGIDYWFGRRSPIHTAVVTYCIDELKVQQYVRESLKFLTIVFKVKWLMLQKINYNLCDWWLLAYHEISQKFNNSVIGTVLNEYNAKDKILF